MDKKGLTVNDKLKCKWKEKNENSEILNLILVNVEKSSPVVDPDHCTKGGKFSIVTHYLGCGDGGGAGAGISLEVDRVGDSCYEVDFDGKTVFRAKKDLGDFVYQNVSN